jgi:hypothetical protein
MLWWIIVGAALVIAYAICTMLWRRHAHRLHERDVNRRIDERLDGMDLKRRPPDEP